MAKQKTRICVIDYGMGNVGSICNMLKKVGAEAERVGNPARLAEFDGLILPGVGAFDNGITRLNEGGWRAPLEAAVVGRKIPVLGICLGMQLLTEASEEGDLEGIGWVSGRCRKFDFGNDSRLKVPHMGWNEVSLEKDSKLFREWEGEEKRFYFVHSYYFADPQPDVVLLTAEYGKRFVCGFERENIFGVQFHPEKSHRFGKQVFKNYVDSICSQ